MSPYDINEKLLSLYGYEQLTGKVKYRLIRSELQTEKQTGNYNLFTESGIFIRNETGTREIKKYWYLKRDCWVLERVEANLDRYKIIAEKYTYEPLLPFLDGNDNPLPLTWKPIEMLLHTVENMEKKFKTEKDHFEEEEKRLAEEEAKVFGALDEPDPIHELPSFKTSSILDDTRKYLGKPSLMELI